MPFSDLLRADPWLSLELGRRVFSLGWPEGGPPGGEALAAALAGLGPGPLMVQAKLPAGDLAGSGMLEEAGFRLVETSLLLQRPLAGLVPGLNGAVIRKASPADEEAVAAIARRAFTHSRLLRDPLIGPEAGGRIKEAWARNYFRGRRGDAMLVAEREAEVAGFVLLLSQGPALVVDLIAVALQARGRGMGGGLLEAAMAWGTGREVTRAGTQLTNTASLALYQGRGFRLTGGQLVFHHHR